MSFTHFTFQWFLSFASETDRLPGRGFHPETGCVEGNRVKRGLLPLPTSQALIPENTWEALQLLTLLPYDS